MKSASARTIPGLAMAAFLVAAALLSPTVSARVAGSSARVAGSSARVAGSSAKPPFPQSFSGRLQLTRKLKDDRKPPPTSCYDLQTGIYQEQCSWTYSDHLAVDFPEIKFLLRQFGTAGQYDLNPAGTRGWTANGSHRLVHVWTDLAPPPFSGPGDTPRVCSYHAQVKTDKGAGGARRAPKIRDRLSGTISITKRTHATIYLNSVPTTEHYSDFTGDCDQWVNLRSFENPEKVSLLFILTGRYEPAKEKIVFDSPIDEKTLTVKGHLAGPP